MSIEAMRELKTLASVCPELNMANYTEDDVRQLNDWAIEISLLVEQYALSQQPDNAACKSVQKRIAAQQPATGAPVAWRNVIPGGRKTDEWESTRIADYNLGWNAYRKAAKTALEHLETSTQPLPSAWMYTLEYGGTIADTKVSLRQLNYPFGVCGADYLRENSDGISYVRQTPLYTHPAPSVPDDVVRDAISTVREHYRGTDWGKAAESICDAIDAMLAAK